jgi:hypothetical protein
LFTGVLNPGVATTFQFGSAVPANATLFVFGRGNDWPTSAIATDISGADVDLTVSLPNPSGNPALVTSGSVWARNPGTNFSGNLGGWSFDVGELTGTGNLADVASIRLDRSTDTFDPTLVGYAVIPAPSSAALVLLFGGLILRRVRRAVLTGPHYIVGVSNSSSEALMVSCVSSWSLSLPDR